MTFFCLKVLNEYALESGNFDITSIDPRFTDKETSETQMGKVYARLVNSVTPSDGNLADSILNVYSSPICKTIDNCYIATKSKS